MEPPKCKCGRYKDRYFRNEMTGSESWDEWRCWDCEYEDWMMSYWYDTNSACRELMNKLNKLISED